MTVVNLVCNGQRSGYRSLQARALGPAGRGGVAPKAWRRREDLGAAVAVGRALGGIGRLPRGGDGDGDTACFETALELALVPGVGDYSGALRSVRQGKLVVLTKSSK